MKHPRLWFARRTFTLMAENRGWDLGVEVACDEMSGKSTHFPYRNPCWFPWTRYAWACGFSDGVCK